MDDPGEDLEKIRKELSEELNEDSPTETDWTKRPKAKKKAEADVILKESPLLWAGYLFSLVASVYFIRVNNDSIYGFSVFFLLPAALGFGLAVLLRSSKPLPAFLALLVTTGILIFFEGLICVAMAAALFLPFAILGLVLGRVFGKLDERYQPKRDKGKGPPAALSIMPLALFLIASGVESFWPPAPALLVIESSIVLPVPPAEAWQAIIAIERVQGPKPLLLQLGLPVPVSCSFEGGGVGARRVCYFDKGLIEERVVHWEPPARLEVSIERDTLPGRSWMEFIDATYELEQTEAGTRVRRWTTISSRLRPRIYWQIFERLGVEAEHDYLLNALRIQLSDQISLDHAQASLN